MAKWERIPEGFYAVPVVDGHLLGHVLWKREGYWWSRMRYVPAEGCTQTMVKAADPDDDISVSHLEITATYVLDHLTESSAAFEQLACSCERCGEPLTTPYAKWLGLDAVCHGKTLNENATDADAETITFIAN